MRSVLLALSSLLITLALGGPASAGSGPDHDARLAKLREAYLAGLFKAKPHLGSYMGDHTADGRLPDLSGAALARRAKELATQSAELQAIPADALSLDDRIDREIMADGVALEELYLTEIKDWAFDPRLRDSFPTYDPRELVAERVAGLMHDESLPVARRSESLIRLLGEIPALLARYRQSLVNPPALYTQRAIKDNAGRIELFKTEVARFVGGLQDRAARVRSEASLKKALTELESYQTFLEKELAPRSRGDWRLGAELYRKKFPLALSTALTPDQALKRAEASFAESRRELYAVTLKLHRELLPGVPVPAPDATPADQSAAINRVKDAIGKDHPKPEELVASHAAGIDRMRRFIVQNDLIRLPPEASLLVTATPPFKRGVMAAEYLSPNILDPSAAFRGTYYVDPVDPTWPKEKVESYLRGNCTAANELTAIHEAYPGHHVQTWYAKQRLNPLRATLWNAPMVEGWAVYGENLMVNRGWGGASNDRYRFLMLRGHLIVAANLVLDVKLHTGRMTDEEALRYLIDECFYEKAGAEKKLLRAKLDSTQLSQYFLGFDEIRELEREYRARVKERFSQREFNERLVGHGSIGVKYLRRYLLGGS